MPIATGGWCMKTSTCLPAAVGELPVEPLQTVGVELALDASLSQRVEEDEPHAILIVHRLHESARRQRRLGEDGEERAALIVIPENEPVGQRQRLELRPQILVGEALAAIGKIAGDDAEGGVGVKRVDLADSRGKPFVLVGAEADQSPWSEVKVRQMDYFHRHTFRRRACDRRPDAAEILEPGNDALMKFSHSPCSAE